MRISNKTKCSTIFRNFERISYRLLSIYLSIHYRVQKEFTTIKVVHKLLLIKDAHTYKTNIKVDYPMFAEMIKSNIRLVNNSNHFFRW